MDRCSKQGTMKRDCTGCADWAVRAFVAATMPVQLLNSMQIQADI